MKFEKQQSTQDWLPFESIYDNGLIFYKNSFLKILKVNPINYDLKSNLEKEAILNSYKSFLKTCDFDIQILIQSKKEDISKMISQLKDIKENNKKITEIKEDFINYITKLNQEKNSSSKNFYIIIRKKLDIFNKATQERANEESRVYEYLNECYFKIKETLSKCGNLLYEVTDKQEILNIFSSFLK